MLKSFSKEQIIERIRFENPWWKTGKIENYYNEMPRRLYFSYLCLWSKILKLKERLF